MKKAFFILGFLGLVVINSAQTDSADIIVADSTEEISEISDSTMMEEIPEDNVRRTKRVYRKECHAGNGRRRNICFSIFKT